MNIYTPSDIETVLEATLGPEGVGKEPYGGIDLSREDARREFVSAVGQAVAQAVTEEKVKKHTRVAVIAGSGICGAYALSAAVALHRADIRAEVYLLNIGGDRLSPSCRRMRNLFVEVAGEEYLYETTGLQMQLPELDRSWIVVDGLFGREHQGALMGGYQHLARYINESGAHVVSIDLPSGMSPDLTVGMINRNIIHAALTLTLVGTTPSFFMRENAELVGRWRVLDVPYDQEALKSVRCRARLIEGHNIRKILPERDAFASKADLGSLVIFAGSYGMLGAAVLSTRAALRSGCGKVTCFTPRCGFFVIQTSVPSALFQTDGSDVSLQAMELNHPYSAIAVGPGIGTADCTIDALETLLKQAGAASRPMVLDADALNCIALRPTMMDHVPAMSILTPHEGEFDRLFGPQPSGSARLLKAIEVATTHAVILVLKGRYTATVWPDGSVLFNSSGTPALATAGSGDVLTGLIGGLMARGLTPELAAVAGVYIHGVAGGLAAATHGIDGTTAEDIAMQIGPAIETITHPTK